MKKSIVVLLSLAIIALSAFVAVPTIAEHTDTEFVSGEEITAFPGEPVTVPDEPSSEPEEQSSGPEEPSSDHEEPSSEPEEPTEPPVSPFKNPVSFHAGGDAVRAQFDRARDPGSGTRLEYYYYSPVNKGFETDKQFPLVVWVHGLAEGQTTSGPLYGNEFPYWSCKELQSRFSAGGAYIMIPRAPENQAMSWGDALTEPLMNAIRNFAADNNVDTRKIFIGGFSLGAKMVFKCVNMYPNFFAGALPIAPYYTATSDEARGMKNTPVWMFGCTTDLLVNYPTAVSGVFDEIVSAHADKNICRITKFTRASTIWGNAAANNHRIWNCVCADMFVGFEGDVMHASSTKNGSGAGVDLVAPNGVISWMNSCANIAAPEDSGSKNSHSFLDAIINFFKRIAAFFARLFSF